MFIVFDKGNSLSATNSAKCAMATIIHTLIYDSFNKPLVNKKYMTGTFNIWPIKSKLSSVWDVDVLFRYLEAQENNNVVSQKILAHKLKIMLRTLGPHRISTISSFAISDTPITFIPGTVLKHFRIGTPLETFEYTAYIDDMLSILARLKEYISEQNNLEKLTLDQPNLNSKESI